MFASRSSHSISKSISGTSIVSPIEGIVSSPRFPPEPINGTTTEVNAEDLFSKHTVTEVKAIQRTLRNDADAKQEELRQMVGERYRDLLQASASIIAISQSSKRVITALEETRGAIQAQQKLSSLSKPTSNKNADDTHLNSLQVLSAHIKLLLDVPEHLWRLMEKKRYFTAAWLYLLSRVVHRALIRDDEQEGVAWGGQRTDALDQFPLVQRQWDHVSSFRQQIIVRAKQSLQEYLVSPEDVCATLLTLHLLDSQPLTEALVLFFDRRSKSLDVLLSPASSSSPTSPTISKRRRDRSSSHAQAFSGRTIREVKESLLVAFDCICRTVRTVREILEERGSEPSLVRQVLRHIQSDSDPSSSIHPELKLTTEALLATLPSSAHFLQLPKNLRSYKPYVDLDSSSTRVKQDILLEKVEEWFNKSSELLRCAAEKWLLEVQSVKNAWAIRTGIRTWIRSSAGLGDERVTQLETIINDVCRQRIIDLWREALDGAKQTFEERLGAIVTSCRNDKNIGLDASPIHLLFSSPPLPSASSGSLESSFQKYRTTLSKQLLGRTPLLDDVLQDVEASAQSIQHDLDHVLMKSDDTSNVVIQDLVDRYQPLSEQLLQNVSEVLRSQTESLTIDTQSNLDALLFLGYLADQLASPTSIVSQISRDERVVFEFRSTCSSIYETVIDRWREFTVSSSIKRYTTSSHSVYQEKGCVSPSPQLIECLLSLTHAITNLGAVRDTSRHLRVVDRTLHHFLSLLLTDGVGFEGIQDLHDLTLLKKLVDVFKSRVHSEYNWDDVHPLVERKISDLKAKMSTVPSDEEMSQRISEYLARTQLLFAALFMSPLASQTTNDALLPFGIPNMSGEVPPAVELAVSPSRFGLLLVN